MKKNIKKIMKQIEVPSSDGKQSYKVTEYECLDEMGSLYFETTCTCKGFQFKGVCKHLNLLDSAMDEQSNERRE